MPKEKLQIDVTADTKKAQNGLKGLDSSIGKTVKTLATGAAAIYAAKKAFDFMAGSVNLLEADIREFQKTEAIIKATGGVANVTSRQVEELAGSIQNLTGISNTSVMAAENMILTFKNISEDIFPDTINILADMSVMFGSMENASIQVGKALNDPITGVTALTRVGITFTEQQKEQIKVLQKSGDMLGAQTIVLEELESQFGGLAQAVGTNVMKMGNAFDDWRKSIAEGVLPAVEAVAGSLTGFFQKLTESPIETSIRQLEAFGAATKDIAELKKFALKQELIETNTELKKAKINYESIGDVTSRIKELNKEGVDLISQRQSFASGMITTENNILKATEEQVKIAKQYGIELNKETQDIEEQQIAFESVGFLIESNIKSIEKEKGLLSKNTDILLKREEIEASIKNLNEAINKEINGQAGNQGKVVEKLGATNEMLEEALRLRNELSKSVAIGVDTDIGDVSGDFDLDVPTDIIPFEQIQADHQKVLDSYISINQQLLDAGIDTTSQLGTAWQSNTDNILALHGQESAEYLLSLEQQKEAEQGFLDWKAEAWMSNSELLRASIMGLNSAYDSFLSGVAEGTINLSKIQRDSWVAFKKTAIGAIGEMFKAWLVSAVKQMAFGKAAQAAEIVKSTATGSAIAAAYAPAAAFTSLASFGGNAAPASAGITSTVGLAYGLAVAKDGARIDETGRIIGAGTETSDSILAMTSQGTPLAVSNGEGILNAKAMNAYPGLLETLNKGRGFATGGTPVPIAQKPINESSDSKLLMLANKIDRLANRPVNINFEIITSDTDTAVIKSDKARNDLNERGYNNVTSFS